MDSTGRHISSGGRGARQSGQRAASPSFGDSANPPFGDSANPPFGDAAGPSFGDAASPSFGDAAGPSFGDAAGPSIRDAASPSFGDAARTPKPGDRSRSHYSIGELCDEFGVTARALRFYEDEALIAPERRGTTRLYSERDRARLAWILRGKRVGLSLADIKELLDLYDIGDGRRTQRLKTIERCQAQADKLEQQRVDIDATLSELNQFIALVKAQVEES